MMKAREFYTAIVEMESATAEMKEFALHEIQKMDAKLERAKTAKAEKSRSKNQKFDEETLSHMNKDEMLTVAEIKERFGRQVTSSAISASLTRMVKHGKVIRIEDGRKAYKYELV